MDRPDNFLQKIPKYKFYKIRVEIFATLFFPKIQFIIVNNMKNKRNIGEDFKQFCKVS